jgi:hypothetical protein
MGLSSAEKLFTYGHLGEETRFCGLFGYSTVGGNLCSLAILLGIYLAEQEKAKSHATKAEAFKALLKESGVADKRIDAVLRVSDIDSLEMDGDSIKDADKVKKAAAEEWADFIETTTTKGADTPKPPANNGGSKMTKEEIFKIKDATERQQAIADNHELFGF